MAGRLIGAWNPAEDSEGLSMAGALLYTFVAGTTTPKATYPSSTDADAGTNPLANPVVADSAGRFVEIWAADGGVYDLLWKTAVDVDVKLFQTVQALGSSDTGAVKRDFGADGRFNLESRGGVFELEAGDPTPDNTGGSARLGGWAGTQGDVLTLDFATVNVTGALAGSALRGYLAGLTLSTAGSSSTFGIAVGQATDSANASVMSLAAAYTKTTAAWTVGSAQGSLDTGSIANSTAYHVFLIRRPDTGVVDVLVSTSFDTPTLPANYTQKRRIGWMVTDGSAHWVAFYQDGDTFTWKAPTANASSTVTSTTPFLVTLSVPTGVSVEAIIAATAYNGAATVNYWAASSPEIPGGLAASNLYADASWVTSTPSTTGQAKARVRTNTSGQIYFAVSSATSTNYAINTMGWIDRRGRDD